VALYAMLSGLARILEPCYVPPTSWQTRRLRLFYSVGVVWQENITADR
jgi:hypothetical protein